MEMHQPELVDARALRLNEAVQKPWYTVAEVARILGFGESKVRMLIIQGDLRSLKDGRLRRILPEWIDEYIAMRAREATEPQR
jgi:excisionase family DNA binding protein